MPAWDRNVKVTCGICGTSKQSNSYLDTKRAPVVEKRIVQNVPIPLLNHEMV